MEYLKRKINVDKQENQGEMHCSLIDGIRLSIRWAPQENKISQGTDGKASKEEEDFVVNFTKAETEKIMKVLR